MKNISLENAQRCFIYVVKHQFRQYTSVFQHIYGYKVDCWEGDGIIFCSILTISYDFSIMR